MDAKSRSLIDDQAIKERVSKIWEKVFAGSNQVLLHAKRYGFPGMEIIPNPNIHDILAALRLMSAVMATLVADDLLDYDEKRLMLNAKEQLGKMERVAEALIAGNEEDYVTAIADLERQACF